jgi:hypothetical protein
VPVNESIKTPVAINAANPAAPNLHDLISKHLIGMRNVPLTMPAIDSERSLAVKAGASSPARGYAPFLIAMRPREFRI